MSKVKKNSPLVLAYIVDRYPSLSESFVRNEARELMKLGFELRILSLRRAREEDKKLVPLLDGENVVCLEEIYDKCLGRLMAHVGLFFKTPARYLSTLAWVVFRRGPWRLFKAAPFFYDRVRGSGWIHGTFAWDQAGMAMVLSRLLDVPYSFTARAADIFVNPRHLDLKVRSARFIATISEFNVRYLSEKFPEAIGKIHVIHSSHSPDRFKIERHPPSDHVRIVSVGRLVEKKGFDFLLEAIALAKPRLDSDVRCRIIGSGPLEEHLRSRIDELGLAGVVELAGALSPDQTLSEIANASMLVQPCVRAANGDMDGIPNVLMEAMWLGTPVISTRLSGIPELVEHEMTGLLVEPEDSRGLADAIHRIAIDPGPGEALSRQGKDMVNSNFCISREAKKLSELILLQ